MSCRKADSTGRSEDADLSGSVHGLLVADRVRAGTLGLMGRGVMMVEQFCLDGGRCQFGWLLSGMTEPNFGQISMNRRRLGLKPYSKLAAAPWVAANVAYLKDLDFLEGRLKNQKATDRSEDKEENQKQWQPRRKKKGNKDDPQDSATAS